MYTLIDKICARNSYKAINDILKGATLHDLQCIDVVKMLAVKKAIVIYDTGTGKTLLAAAAMRLVLNAKPDAVFIMFVKKDQLVQTPTKLRNYADLSCLVTTAEADVINEQFLTKDLDKYNVLMLTHECLHSTKVLDAIYKIRDKVAGIIIDEAHEYNNFNNASSANVLHAMTKKFEYVWGLTATPIVTQLNQLARLANVVDANKYPDAKKLSRKLLNGEFSIQQDPGFFINRSASDLGRDSNPNGYVITVKPTDYQRTCNLGGVELFQVCKGEGAVAQVEALIQLIRDKINTDQRGLVYINQGSVLKWVCSNLDNTNIRYACINGGTALNKRSEIEQQFAKHEYDVILTSITTAIDLDCDYVTFYEFTVLVNQMIGRAHRGLKPKELDVYFIITKDTNEEDYFINNIAAKCELVRQILGKGNSAVEAVAGHLGY